MQVRFSQRYGHSPVKQAIQLQSMDSDLRNTLWNAIEIHFWQPLFHGPYLLDEPRNAKLCQICIRIWVDFLKWPLDEMSVDWTSVKYDIRKFFFDSPWDTVYDFVEFLAQLDSKKQQSSFAALVNIYLEREVSGYRFVNESITPITNPIEISEIESASSGPTDTVSVHFSAALDFLSDRQTPNYRNSVKESISAVEGQVKASLGVDNGTLGRLLEQLSQVTRIHPALMAAFDKLYGYTSDEGGIRHALMDDSRAVSFEEAKFMLVACSAFVNYIRGVSKS